MIKKCKNKKKEKGKENKYKNEKNMLFIFIYISYFGNYQVDYQLALESVDTMENWKYSSK